MNSPQRHSVYTYSDPVLSLWQAAVTEVQNRHVSVTNRMALPTGSREAVVAVPAQNDLMSPVYILGEPLRLQRQVPEDIVSPIAVPSTALGTSVEAKALIPTDCAKVAAQFLWAEITGNKQKSELYAGELKDSVCDIGWGECVVTYLAYKASGANLVYRPNQNPVFDLGDRKKIALIGDWGTGQEVAINLLQQVANLEPQVLIHLGDVYYAGTHNEEKGNFLDICRNVLGNSVPIFSLCGNHDMYSGGQGYYWLIDQLGQRASYFCLENDDWQFLAMDTGHNDHNPLTVSTNMTRLVVAGSWAEENWLLDKINLAKDRKIVLLSHHQLFSPFGPVGTVDGKPYAYNPNLRSTFEALMKRIAWWFWGHEHTLAIFDPYMGLKRGRCIGASAVPVFSDQQSYNKSSGLETYGGSPLPTWDKSGQLGDNGTFYNHCFAFMTLTGVSASVEYYQVPIHGTATKLPVDDAV